MTFPHETPWQQPAQPGPPLRPTPQQERAPSPEAPPSVGFSPGHTQRQGGYGYWYPHNAPPPIAAEPVAPTGEPLARFSDRLLARLVDYGVLTLVGLVLDIPLIALIFFTLDKALNATAPPDPFALVVSLLGFIGTILMLSMFVSYLYDVELLIRNGQTIGKRVMDLKVITLAGVPLTRRFASKRWLANQVASSLIPIYGWVDGLWQLNDQPYRQCLHDKFSQTVVVRCASRRAQA